MLGRNGSFGGLIVLFSPCCHCLLLRDSYRDIEQKGEEGPLDTEDGEQVRPDGGVEAPCRQDGRESPRRRERPASNVHFSKVLALEPVLPPRHRRRTPCF